MESSYGGALDRGRIILSPREADEVRGDFSDRLVYGGGDLSCYCCLLMN